MWGEQLGRPASWMWWFVIRGRAASNLSVSLLPDQVKFQNTTHLAEYHTKQIILYHITINRMLHVVFSLSENSCFTILITKLFHLHRWYYKNISTLFGLDLDLCFSLLEVLFPSFQLFFTQNVVVNTSRWTATCITRIECYHPCDVPFALKDVLLFKSTLLCSVSPVVWHYLDLI